MDGWQHRSWFAVQSKPHHERLGAANVANLDAEVFFPRIRQEQLVGGIARIVTKPLFSGYFFARFCSALSLDAVRNARGVLRVISAGRIPIPLDDEIISGIREQVQEDGYVQLKPQLFAPGDRITVEEGPFLGLIGRVEREWDDGKRVTVLLEALQQARVLIEKRWLAAG